LDVDVIQSCTVEYIKKKLDLCLKHNRRFTLACIEFMLLIRFM